MIQLELIECDYILFTGGCAWSQGALYLVPGGAWSWGPAWSGGMPCPGGYLVETPPGRLLLRAVCILLECILVLSNLKVLNLHPVLRQLREKNITLGPMIIRWSSSIVFVLSVKD